MVLTFVKLLLFERRRISSLVVLIVFMISDDCGSFEAILLWFLGRCEAVAHQVTLYYINNLICQADESILLLI